MEPQEPYVRANVISRRPASSFDGLKDQAIVGFFLHVFGDRLFDSRYVLRGGSARDPVSLDWRSQ
jgi:hypothetical protein